MEIRFEEIYEDYEILKLFNQEGFYKYTYPQTIANSRKFYYKSLKMLLNYYESLKPFDNSKNSIFMENVERFDYLAEVLSKSFNILTFSRLKTVKLGFSYKKYHTTDFDERLYKGFLEHEVGYAKEVIKEISCIFKKNHIKVVVLSCDRSFIERALVFAAKDNNIPVVVFQHGIFIGDDVGRTKIGIYGDQYWVWCQMIKDKFIEAFGEYQTDIRIMGYPFKTDVDSTIKQKRVLFIGEDYSNLNPEYDAKYNDAARNVLRACNLKGLDFNFRPHPNVNKFLVADTFKDEKGFKFSKISSLMDDINNSIMVVGDFSSVLLEAALINKPVIQIDWGSYVHELLKDKMYSFSIKSINDYDQICIAIDNVLEGKIKTDIDSYYLYRNYNFEKDVTFWLTELIDNS